MMTAEQIKIFRAALLRPECALIFDSLVELAPADRCKRIAEGMIAACKVDPEFRERVLRSGFKEVIQIESDLRKALPSGVLHSLLPEVPYKRSEGSPRA